MNHWELQETRPRHFLCIGATPESVRKGKPSEATSDVARAHPRTSLTLPLPPLTSAPNFPSIARATGEIIFRVSALL